MHIKELIYTLSEVDEKHNLIHMNQILSLSVKFHPGTTLDEKLVFNLLSFGVKGKLTFRFERKEITLFHSTTSLFQHVINFVEERYKAENFGYDRWFITSFGRENEIRMAYEKDESIHVKVDCTTKLLFYYYLKSIFPMKDITCKRIENSKEKGVMDFVDDIFSEKHNFQIEFEWLK